jgi:hypothetical protein
LIKDLPNGNRTAGTDTIADIRPGSLCGTLDENVP